MMNQELWATYSVNDHLNPRALAADILMFDRLVFPVPENGSIPENSGAPNTPGPVEWTRNPEEWKRWQDMQWDPDGQSRLLKLLEPVVRKVSWDKSHREKWRAEAANQAIQDLHDHAFISSRTVLTRDLPSYVTGVAAVGPAYRTVDDIDRELSIKYAEGRTQ